MMHDMDTLPADLLTEQFNEAMSFWKFNMHLLGNDSVLRDLKLLDY